MPIISIVIPTFNRAAILMCTIKALAAQTASKDDFEVIIVDDGSTDETSKKLQTAKEVWGERLTVVMQKNKGQGIARNRGVEKAQGNIILFLGDDIFLEKNSVNGHIAFHKKHQKEREGLLGHIDWHPDLPKTPFLKWLTDGSSVLGKYGGHQFAYEKLQGKEKANFWFFYTSHISIKQSLVQKHPFDPVFSGYGWEDIELGYRLTKEENLDLYYDANIKAHHFHPMEESALERRMRSIGQSAHALQKKYPELKRVPPTWKKGIFRLLSHPTSLAFLKRQKNPTLYYYALSKKYFLEGLNSPILRDEP